MGKEQHYESSITKCCVFKNLLVASEQSIACLPSVSLAQLLLLDQRAFPFLSGVFQVPNCIYCGLNNYMLFGLYSFFVKYLHV